MVDARLYTLESKRTDICNGQYSVVQKFSGDVPDVSNLRDWRKKEGLLEEHAGELKNLGLKSCITTVQWSN